VYPEPVQASNSAIGGATVNQCIWQRLLSPAAFIVYQKSASLVWQDVLTAAAHDLGLIAANFNGSIYIL